MLFIYLFVYLFIYLFVYLAMAKYCVQNRKEPTDEINENRNSINKKSKHGGTSTYNIKECFEEYSLEDKVEALKNILSHNGKLKQNEPSNINNILHIKKPIGVKECLQANQETPFQTLIFELKNTVMNSYWNKEVGKTCYQVPNLPVGMNPLETTFGKRIEPGETVAKILHEETNKNNILEKNIVEMYKKSHNSYLPGEQIKRHYKSPFNENLYFGKPINIRAKGTGVKKLLKWINVDTHTIIDPEFSDFKEHSRSNVEEVSNLNNTPVCTNMEHNINKRTDKEEIRNVFNECSLNDETIKQYNYLQYINNLRLKLKKRIPEIQFVDIFEDLLYFDKVIP
ncbi:uncharacterized protein LOC114875522 isoform X2 [Osmia bicornis bicornis]|uniref:uncharacterized protein LOC114875522 isoform X2 n=1 Tax=Osmia bicornis bicornis TaxID=1437191 RepID=UPI001EAF3042|nr:uncharacterized protein LOC114875522 isoform X2 [Osmia bicornis bicornis]